MNPVENFSLKLIGPKCVCKSVEMRTGSVAPSRPMTTGQVKMRRENWKKNHPRVFNGKSFRRRIFFLPSPCQFDYFWRGAFSFPPLLSIDSLKIFLVVVSFLASIFLTTLFLFYWARLDDCFLLFRNSFRLFLLFISYPSVSSFIVIVLEFGATICCYGTFRFERCQE